MSRDYISLTRIEKLNLLNKELEKVQHEINISELIYSLHGSDTYEDLFRDNIPALNEKRSGIVEALKNLEDNSVSFNLSSDISDLSSDSD